MSLYRSGRTVTKSEEKFEFPVATARTCSRSTNADYRETFQMPGDGFQLSKGDQTVLHAAERRRQKVGDGCLVPGIGEIVGGSQREERSKCSRKRSAGPKWIRPITGGTSIFAVLAGAPRRLRARLRAHADVRHRRVEHPRRDSRSPHARQRGILHLSIALYRAGVAMGRACAATVRAPPSARSARLRRSYMSSSRRSF